MLALPQFSADYFILKCLSIILKRLTLHRTKNRSPHKGIKCSFYRFYDVNFNVSNCIHIHGNGCDYLVPLNQSTKTQS